MTKVGIALGLALLFFLIGWFVGRGPVAELRERAESAERRYALMQDQFHMTQSEALLYQTALDLDSRNFGTANDRLDEAASALSNVGQAGTQLSNLRTVIASTDINVAEDLAGQRASVLEFAETLRSLIAGLNDPVESDDTDTHQETSSETTDE